MIENLHPLAQFSLMAHSIGALPYRSDRPAPLARIA
jgi:hypothetical protein